jgi:hypothetical protein
MNYRAGLAAAMLLAAALASGETPIQLYQIDLSHGGSMFALDKPTLQGDVYVFRGWPEGTKTRLQRAQVLRISAWTKNPVAQIAYRIDLVPSGHLLSRDNPTLKSGMYVFRTSRDGTAMSVRQSDVRKITRLTGADAFWAEQRTRGEVPISNLAMQGGSSQAGPQHLSTVGPRSVDSGTMGAQSPGNWLYQGTPGVSDAWAPAAATVASPGDAPTMPAATDGGPAPQ